MDLTYPSAAGPSPARHALILTHTASALLFHVRGLILNIHDFMQRSKHKRVDLTFYDMIMV